MKRIFARSLALALAAVFVLSPLSVSAKELKSTEYNKEVTKSNGDLKLGYKATDDSTKTWWKTETWYTDWKEADKAAYDAVKDNDLKKVEESGQDDWRKVDKATYDEYKAKSPDDARTNGYTDFKAANKQTFDATPEDLRKSEYSDWTEVDKATYDAETNPDLKGMTASDWAPIAGLGTWDELYEEWLKIPEENRRLGQRGDYFEVSKDEYTAYAAKFPGKEGDLYYYEDGAPRKTFDGWVFFDEQIIANVYNANGGHDPFYILVGEFNPNGYSGCEGGTWDGVDDGVRYLDFNNGGSAQNIGESTLDYLNSNGVPYTTISSGSDIPALGANKYNTHSVDPNHNSGKDSGNGFIDIVDDDFKIYYYGGSDTINVQELYGVLIAPYATVNVGGKWIGTIIADTVNTAGNWHESAKWCYPIDKGEVDRKYFIAHPYLEAMYYRYKVRTVNYFVRDYVYEVRDIVKKYYVRELEQKKYYCETAPYVPKTGDLGTLFMLGGLCIALFVGMTLVGTSFRKDRRNRLR